MDWWGAIAGDETRQGYVGLALVVGTGLATSVFALSHASESAFGPGEAMYVFTPVVVSIALVLTGALLWTAGFDGSEMLRIGCGVFLGMGVFGLLVTWTITHEFIRGDSFAHALFVTVNSMSVGGFVGLVLGWLDARNRRYEARLERERNRLKRQTEELDEFAGIVSHDLRNPLNVATLELQTARATADEETREALDDVESPLTRMEQIIDDVLAMARDGDTITETEPVSLGAVARHSWENVDTGRAALEVAHSTTLAADRNALEHVFENLFRNSVEHGSAGGTTSGPPEHGSETDVDTHTGRPVVQDGGKPDLAVRVGTLAEGFYVEDDGVGIPADVRSTLFESGVTTNEQGTGIGLSIVEKLVSGHGWEIRATSSDEGGARFEITGVESTAELSRDSWLSALD